MRSMPQRPGNRFFLRTLAFGWSIPLTLLALPLATFNIADRFWMTVSLLTLVAVFAACWVAEGAPRDPFNRPSLREPPTPQQCRRAAVFFGVLTCVGSILILVDQQQTLAAFEFENLQEKYLAVVAISNAGDRLGTFLSTIGTALRSFIYVGIVGLVAQTAQTRTMRGAWLPLLLVLAGIVLSTVATTSRTFLIFCVLVAVVCGLLLKHPLLRRPGLLLCGLLLAGAYLAVTTGQRLEAALGDQSLAFDFLESFFEVTPGSLGNWIADYTGAPGLAAALYLAHPLPEFSRLVADGSTPYALGTHSLFLIVEPALRLVGVELSPESQLVQRPGMWWGSFGDLYMDFGAGFVVAYPLMIYFMVRVARRLGMRTVYGLSLQCVTATMLFASPFFGVMNTYSFTYFGLLALAWWQSGRCSARVRANQHVPVAP